MEIETTPITLSVTSSSMPISISSDVLIFLLIKLVLLIFFVTDFFFFDLQISYTYNAICFYLEFYVFVFVVIIPTHIKK